MAYISRNFTAGKMNKSVDERLVPDGEYIDAMNVRMGSTEKSEVGVIENTKGNLPLSNLSFNGSALSSSAKCIGAIDDSARETIYWFVHDPDFASSPTGKIDLIVSFNVFSSILTYHVISVNDGGGVDTTLNFNSQYLITGVDLVEDLLFFTEDYNPPRFININSSYSNPTGSPLVDGAGNADLLYESLLVIKKPPTAAPTLNLVTNQNIGNFLEDRFICFAYRYRYGNGEYSATSQWSEVAFIPGPFEFSQSSFTNEGMQNEANSVEVTYNTGGPLVVGIDLLFKESNNNVIKVIEKLGKTADNINQTYLFDGSKIFTVLNESELLRLYDNVPRFAKAQTIMGNRLVYGNYVEGYDLVDKNGNPVNLDYYIEHKTEDNSVININTSLTSGTYNINGPISLVDSVLEIDLTNIPLTIGSIISFNGSISYDTVEYVPNPSTNPPNFNYYNNPIDFSFSIYLSQNYNSVYDLATSAEFQNKIGTISNIQPTSPLSALCNGTTMTDEINCKIENYVVTLSNSGTWGRVGAGINNILEPISIITSTTSNIIQIQFLSQKYTLYNSAGVPVGEDMYVYFKVIEHSALYQKDQANKSLHSNRGYEIGLIYMDEFNRSTPVNVSQNNTVQILCENSKNVNKIYAYIPPTQLAPAWAKRYKFVCRTDKYQYDTIYSNIFFKDPDQNDYYFLLQGENMRKVEVGDRLIVKATPTQISSECIVVTVLEKEAKQANFLDPNILSPSGVYFKVSPSGFNFDASDDAVIAIGPRTDVQTNYNPNGKLDYPLSVPDISNPGNYLDISIPIGSIINIYVKFSREGFGDNACETRMYTYEKRFISSANYSSIYDWWNGDNIATTINSGSQFVAGNNCAVNNVYVTGLFPTQRAVCDNYWQVYKDPTTNQQGLLLMGPPACTGWFDENKRNSVVTADITIFRTVDTVVFETEPQETLPDIFYENNLSFEIDSNGYHMGNLQNQTSSQSAIVDTEFFNCFCFGNGVESYKIRDSILGKDFNLGERVNSVSSQDYKEIRRIADMTYSGVFNPETNVNKLNEFNLGLLNYKNLELSFGAIQLIDGRETDILVLQEDKISYVLAGKNLLSDAAAGGVITSIPEVLGTQIARVEKYGISFNPESYVQWGFERFFTDAKRGAVLSLRGNSSQNDQLNVISEMGMRSWFRDTFNSSFNTQKLGAYDPYLNEYVLSTNDVKIPIEEPCVGCGTNRTFYYAQGEGNTSTYDFCVNLNAPVGDVNVTWNVVSIDLSANFEVDVTYNGTTYNSGIQTSSGSLTFTKNLPNVNECSVSIIANGNVAFDFNLSCPVVDNLTVIKIVLTNDNDSGQITLIQGRYEVGSYVSPLDGSWVVFASGSSNPLVSSYQSTYGAAGTGYIPIAGSTYTMINNKIYPSFVNFNFDVLTDKFKYLRTNVLYGNNSVDLNTLIPLLQVAGPITQSGNIHQAQFTVDPTSAGQYLYLVWDYRAAEPVQLCYTANPAELYDICCDCSI